MKHQARGFTLIELVVTVAIVGILASIAVPLGEISMRRAKEYELRSALRQIRNALDAYKKATEEGRILRRADGTGYPRSLDELDGGVTDVKSPTEKKIYFLRRLPRDPLFADTTVPAVDTWGTRAYSSAPNAPTEGEDVFDVFSRSTQLGLNGVAYSEW